VAALIVSGVPKLAHSQAKPEVHAQAAQLPLDEVVTRMEQARLRNKQTPPFLLTRQYQMFHGDEQTPASQVKAQISVVPPSDRDYKIIESQGSDRGEKVVRKILEHEAAAEKLNPSPTAIVRANYNFTDAGREMLEGVNCYVLGLKPKREEPSLIEGKAWIDPNTFAVRKIAGKMSKSPSWWVKDVDLVVSFGEIGGVWMQTASHAVADVRVIGKYTVQGRALDVQTATSEAANIQPRMRTKSSGHRSTALPATLIYAGPTGRR
jgi:hypothetical protein